MLTLALHASERPPLSRASQRRAGPNLARKTTTFYSPKPVRSGRRAYGRIRATTTWDPKTLHPAASERSCDEKLGYRSCLFSTVRGYMYAVMCLLLWLRRSKGGCASYSTRYGKSRFHVLGNWILESACDHQPGSEAHRISRCHFGSLARIS